MDFSSRIRKEAKYYGVRPDWIVMADLRSIGYTDVEVYSIVHPEACALSADKESTLRNNITANANYKKLVADRKERLSSSSVMSIVKDDIDLITPEQVAKEILRSAMSLPEGSKERGDMLVKYEEVLRKNADVDTHKQEDDGVGIYLPLKCCQCKLFAEYSKKNQQNAQSE